MDDQLRANNTPMIMKLYEAALSMGSKLLFSQFASIPDVLTAPRVILFVATAKGPVVPIVDIHERVIDANGQHKLSQSDRLATAPPVSSL